MKRPTHKNIPTPLLGPNSFQQRAIERIGGILGEHHVRYSEFAPKVGGQVVFWTSFMFEGQEHVLAIFEGSINMQQGKNLYESYMPDEFKSAEDLIEGFAQRLDRYLGGGAWQGTHEKSAVGRLASQVRKVLRRE